jgi:hypothetical protein
MSRRSTTTARSAASLHPVHYMIKTCPSAKQGDLGNGIWPPGLGEVQLRYDAQFAVINSPTTPQIQAQPQNQSTVHPLLDGGALCEGKRASFPSGGRGDGSALCAQLGETVADRRSMSHHYVGQS